MRYLIVDGTRTGGSVDFDTAPDVFDVPAWDDEALRTLRTLRYRAHTIIGSDRHPCIRNARILARWTIYAAGPLPLQPDALRELGRALLRAQAPPVAGPFILADLARGTGPPWLLDPPAGPWVAQF